VPLAVLVVATVRTAEAFRPVRLEQRLGALLVGSVDLEQVPQALSLLELDALLRHSGPIANQILIIPNRVFLGRWIERKIYKLWSPKYGLNFRVIR
jgi:hypothetical protein